ncbi:MAG: MFS transporter, partial [Sulfobacillus sp.]
MQTATPNSPITFGDLPIGKFVRRLTILSAMGLFLDGYDLTIISVALLFIKPQFHPAPYLLGLVGAAALGGMFVGSLVLGNLSDRFGRRTMYLFDLLFFVVFAILSALSQNMIELIIFRFFLGIGIGADYPISSALTAEFSPTKRRGMLLVTTIAFWQVGAVAAYAASLLMLHLGPEAWRWMLASGAIPALVVMWLRRTIPESPRWLAAAGRKEEGDKIAQAVAREQGVTLKADTVQTSAPPKLASFRRLFEPDLIRLTIFAAGCWFLFDVGDYGTIVFFPTIFKMMAGSTLESSVLASGAIAAIAFVGIAIDWLIVDKIGRKIPQAVGFLGLGLIFIAMALIKPAFAIFLLLFLIMYIFQQGPGQMTYVFPGEVFPTSVRATGHGF